MPQGHFGDTPFGGFEDGVSGVNVATAETIVKGAYRKIMVPNPSVTQLTNGVEALESWLASGWTQRLHVCEVILDVFPLIAGVNSYTIGAGGLFNATRPIKIQAAYLRLAGQDYKLTVGVLRDQAEIFQKSQTGRPRFIYYAQEYPNGAILFDVVPDQAYTLWMQNWKPLLTIEGLTTQIALPSEYNRAMIFNLAMELAPEVNQKVSPELANSAAESLEWITSVNGSEATEVRFDAMIPSSDYRGRSILDG